MDPITPGSSNPTNNPRLDLLHSGGDNQQLAGAAGSYGPSPAASYSASAIPAGAAPKTASSYVAAAQTDKPEPAPAMPEPRPVPAYTSVGGGGGDEDGGVGIGTIIVGIIALLLVAGGLYFYFSSQLSNQNKQLQTALKQINGQDNNGNGSDIKSNTITNADKLTTKTLEVTGSDDSSVDSLTVNGSSSFQGPVKFGQDVTINGSLDVSGTVTASAFKGDGSGLTGVGSAGPAGPQGARGFTGATGAQGPKGNNGNNCGTGNCVSLQSGTVSPEVGDISVTGSGAFGGSVGIGDQVVPLGGTLLSLAAPAVGVQLVSTDTDFSSNIFFSEYDGISGVSDIANIFSSGSTALTNPNSLTIANIGGGDIVFITNNAEMLRITDSGAVNIAGATTINNALTVNSTINGQTISNAASFTGSVQAAGDITSNGTVYGNNLSINGGQIASNGANIDVTNGSIRTQFDLCAGSSDCTVGGATSGGNIRAFGGTSGRGTVSADNGYIVQGIDGVTTNGGVPCLPNEHIQVKTVVGGIVTSSGGCQSGADYAEYYQSSQSLAAGDVVALDPASPEHVIKTSSSNQATAIGVVSTQPGEVIGTTTGFPVALAGRVPVKVTNQNGPIQPGDYLTSSSTPGYAMKANAGDKTIAQALEALNAPSGQIVAFINISNGGGLSQPQGSGDFSDLNVSGAATVDSLTVNGSATVADLVVTGATTVASITVNGHIVGNADTRGEVTIQAGATSVHHSFQTPYAAKPVVVASPEGVSVLYHVDSSASGFDISVDTPVAADTKFNYLVQQ